MSLFPTTNNHDADDFIGQLQSEINSANQTKIRRFEFIESDSKSDCSSSESLSDDSDKFPVVSMTHSEVKETRRRINFDSEKVPTMDYSFNPKTNLLDVFMNC